MQDEEEVASSARDSSRGQKLDGCSWAAQAWGWTIFVIPDLDGVRPTLSGFRRVGRVSEGRTLCADGPAQAAYSLRITPIAHT